MFRLRLRAMTSRRTDCWKSAKSPYSSQFQRKLSEGESNEGSCRGLSDLDLEPFACAWPTC